MRSSLALALAVVACAPVRSRNPVPEADLAVDRVGDVAVLPLSGEAFNRLTREERVLAFHLARAAAAAHPVVEMQNHRQGRAIRELADALAGRADLLDPAFAAALRDYRHRLFLHRGNHDAFTELKFVPDFTAADLSQAVRRLREAGVELPLDEVGAELEAAVFDPMCDRLRVNKFPGTLRDPVRESAVNHYAPGITSWDLVGFEDRHPLNSRIERREGKLVEDLYRAGGQGVPPGLGAPFLAAAVRELDAALPLAGDGREGLARMAAALERGDGPALAQASPWAAPGGRVEFAFGFADRSSDPREQKGTLEALVVLPDPGLDALFARAAALGPELGSRLPWPAGGPPAASGQRVPELRAVRLAASSGSALAFTPPGLAWPGRLPAGAGRPERRWLALEQAQLEDDVLGERVVRELVLPEVAPEAARCFGAVRLARAVYRELFGHAWSEPRPGAGEENRKRLAPFFSVVEEARAELVADLFVEDPRTVSSGLLPDAGCQRVAPQLIAMEPLAALRFVPQGDAFQNDRLRALQLIQGWQVGRGALDLVNRGGRHHARVVDPEQWRQGLGALFSALAEVARNGDRGAIEKMVERFAPPIDPRLRDEVLARLHRIGAPWRVAVLPPVLTAVRDPEGRVIDAAARPARSLEDFMTAFAEGEP